MTRTRLCTLYAAQSLLEYNKTSLPRRRKVDNLLFSFSLYVMFWEMLCYVLENVLVPDCLLYLAPGSHF